MIQLAQKIQNISDSYSLATVNAEAVSKAAKLAIASSRMIASSCMIALSVAIAIGFSAPSFATAALGAAAGAAASKAAPIKILARESYCLDLKANASVLSEKLGLSILVNCREHTFKATYPKLDRLRRAVAKNGLRDDRAAIELLGRSQWKNDYLFANLSFFKQVLDASVNVYGANARFDTYTSGGSTWEKGIRARVVFREVSSTRH